MKIDNYYKPIYLDRTTAIALLVRLENGDIPYPHSKNCREQLAYFLSYILTDENRNDKILLINFDELSQFVNDVDSAFTIMQSYSTI